MMNTKKRGLGRAFDALLSSAKPLVEEKPVMSVVEGELRQLDVLSIQPGRYQPRHIIANDSLNELADSIREQGIIQPIVVRPINQNRYEIIAGERRWRAAQLANLTEIPALIRHVPDEAAIAMALIENIQRENLNPIEEASALQRLLVEFAMTHQQVASAVGKSRSGITNLLRLLELDSEVKTLVEEGKLSLGHAKVLLGVTGVTQLRMARTVVEKDLSVRETEQLIQKAQTIQKPHVMKSFDPDVQKLERQLSNQLGAGVSIAYNKKGCGKLMIKFFSLDQLDGILSHLK